MEPDRRQFLKVVARKGMGAAALATLPATILEALAIPAHNETGSIDDVKHIVILMQENRSFDHYFGTMRGVRGFGDPKTIPMESGKPVWFQNDGIRDVVSFHLDMEHMNALKINTTAHFFADAQAAWNQGKFGFWPKYKIDLVTGKADGLCMGHYSRQELPFQFALAEAFTICDQYHCSVQSGTDPNRIVFFSGAGFNPELRAQGINSTDADSEPNNLRCWVRGKWPTPGYTYQGSSFRWPSIPDVLQAAGISWRIYQDPNNNFLGLMHGALAFESFRSAKPGSDIYRNGMSHWSLEDLKRDVQNNQLPAVSWILPSQATCEHPAGSSPVAGADFTRQILDALTANPEVWSKTVLFITFDENDGFFDHVPPPAIPSYNKDGTLAGKSTMPLDGMYFQADGEMETDSSLTGTQGGKRTIQYLDARDSISGNLRPWGLGPRVPMYVVSPWSKGGWVSSQVFDHTSVARFIEKRFNLVIPAITPWHRAVCGDLTSAFDFVSPNDSTFPELPDTTRYAALEAAQSRLPRAAPPPDVAVPPAQETGVRPSRATPYELHVDEMPLPAGGVGLRLRNTGQQGAVLHVYDKLHLDRIPRRYTVEAGKEIEDDYWSMANRNDGHHDLEIHGPNGFLRVLSGPLAEASGGLQALVQYDRPGVCLKLRLINHTRKAIRIELIENAYLDPQWIRMTVVPGGTVDKRISLKKSHRWYDLRLRSAEGYFRRFAGCLETGVPGISDPAIGHVRTAT
ncbi:MAG: phospholipase C, phosphocholine-specific [Proteobacteria bacterium]|nr:phospholipase C, phosphocholine-specific [Pseudomonadota bacterium]HQR03640.1 phospholipase C, phosphocholine-specific [Rhodocyclaceae bacterium]